MLDVLTFIFFFTSKRNNLVFSFYLVEMGGFMVYELFIHEEIKYIDDEYRILDTDNINNYNKQLIYEKFLDMLKCIKEEECKYLDLSLPNISQNLEINYEKSSFNKTSSTEKYALDRIETEEDLLYTYSRLKAIFDKSLSYYEKVIFIDSLLLKKTRDSIERRLFIGNERFYQIRNSCLIKFALGLNWQNIKVNKSEKLN